VGEGDSRGPTTSDNGDQHPSGDQQRQLDAGHVFSTLLRSREPIAALAASPT
jgi:hypothetical protein